MINTSVLYRRPLISRIPDWSYSLHSCKILMMRCFGWYGNFISFLFKFALLPCLRSQMPMRLAFNTSQSCLDENCTRQECKGWKPYLVAVYDFGRFKIIVSASMNAVYMRRSSSLFSSLLGSLVNIFSWVSEK